MTAGIKSSIISELADFLVSEPSLDQLAGYTFPEAVQVHLATLLEKNREGQLSSAEGGELDQLLAMVQLMNMAKIKAKLKLADKT